MKLTEIAKKGSLSLLLQFTGLAVSLVLNLYMTNVAGKEAYNVYVVSFSWITFLAHMGLIGYDVLLTREISNPNNSEELKSALLSRSINYALLISFFLGSLLILGTILFVTDDTLKLALILSAAAVPFFSLLLLLKAYLIGKKRNDLAIVCEKLIRPGIFIFAIATIIGVIGSLSIAWIILINTGAIFTALMTAIIISKIKLNDKKTSVQVDDKYKKAAWTFFFLSFVAMTNNLADVLMLGFWPNTVSEVGTYKIDLNLTNFIAMPLLTLNAVFAPYFVEYFNDPSKSNNLIAIKNLLRIVFAFGLVLCIAFTLKPNFFLNFFGQDYLLGATPLVVLSFGQLFNVFMGPVGNALNMANAQQSVFKISAFTLCINLLLNLVLIPYYGLLGASAATVITLAIWNLLLAYQLKNKFGINVTII